MIKYVMWALVAVIIIGGGYFAYTKYMTTPDTTGEPAAENLPQVQAQDVEVGTGAEAAPGTLVSVLYTGRFTDGTVFDSSAAHNNEPLSFILGSQGLIPGFQIGVNGMKMGGKRTIAIPPELGYGSEAVKDAQGNVIIPANATLIFDIELVNVQAAPQAEGENSAQ